MSDDLKKRLRKKRERCHDLSGVYWTEDMDCQEAADRIEELEAERNALAEKLADGSFYQEKDIDAWQNRIEELEKACAEWADRALRAEARAERLEEALLWCSGSDDFNEGGVARKGWLKVCAPLLRGESHDH